MTAAGNMRHAGGHDDHQLRLRHLGQEGTDGQRRFGLSHEDAGGDVHRLDAAGAHEAHHDLRQLADDELHHAVVIKDGEERRDEDDDRQHLEGEDEAVFRDLAAQLAKDKLRADKRIAQQPFDRVPGHGHHSLAPTDTQHQQRQRQIAAPVR